LTTIIPKRKGVRFVKRAPQGRAGEKWVKECHWERTWRAALTGSTRRRRRNLTLKVYFKKKSFKKGDRRVGSPLKA